MAAGSLLVDIGMNIARLQADVGKATSLFANGMKKMSNDVGFLKNSLVGLVSVGSLAALGHSVMQMGDDIAKATSKLGIGAEKLQALKYAAELSDVSFEALQKGMKKFSQAIIEANAAGSDAATAFSVMGIATKDAAGKTLPLDVLFAKVADRFSQMEDGAGKVSIAVALFGRAGMDMIPVLNKGSAGLREATNELNGFGGAISGENIKRLEAWNDQFKKMNTYSKLAAASLMSDIGDAINWLFRQNDVSLNLTKKLNKAIFGDGFGPDAKTFKAPPPPGKITAPNLDEIKKAAEEKKKLEEAYQKIHAANMAKEGELVHNALAAEMGMDQEYYDTLTKLREDDFNEWKKMQDEILKLDAAHYEAEGKIIHDALAEEMGYGDKPTTPYLFEDALKAAEAYGNISLAIDTMNSKLGEQYAITAEGQTYISLYKQAWLDANLAIADSMMSLYSGMQAWISSSIQGLVQGTLKIQDVLANLGKMMLSIISDYIAKWVVSRLFLLAMEKTTTATSIALEKVATAAYVGSKIAQATASTGAGAARALSEFPWPYSAGVAAAVLAEGAAIIAGMTIISSVAGAAHGGLDYVPAETTYLLDRGERVVSPKQNEDLTNFLGGKDGRSSGGGDVYFDGDLVGRWLERRSSQYGNMKLVFT